jgi:hypothetical protein
MRCYRTILRLVMRLIMAMGGLKWIPADAGMTSNQWRYMIEGLYSTLSDSE